MFEVVIDCLRYVQGVPVELTAAAVAAGELRKGSVVGLDVYPAADPANKVLIEVVLDEDGQGELIKPGLTIPLDGESGRFRLIPDWRGFIPRLADAPAPLEVGAVSGNRSTGADPGTF